MIKIKALFVLFCLFFSLSIFAQEKLPGSTGFTISLNQDPALGFYPEINGVITLKDNMEFTYYGIFWTQTALGNNFAGYNLYTELGAGINYIITDNSEEYLSLNPQIGIGNGNLCSGGGRPVFADAIIPRISAYYEALPFKISMQMILYKGLRKESAKQNYLDQFEMIITPTYDISKIFSAGLYFDLFQIKETKLENKDAYRIYVYYLWLGPLININIKRNISTKFMFGFDFVDYFNCKLDDKDKILKDFYKLTTSISF